ncbi:proteoglycan 4-like isoform X1 [Mobula hypostoma]|uniref:proteoglycan 4-like isoform X1 n=2 Tax=Mobula hypostoma TaxID=723540 RepID=UPI002FC362E0
MELVALFLLVETIFNHLRIAGSPIDKSKHFSFYLMKTYSQNDTQLRLSRMNISSIPVNTFQSLSGLEILELSQNNLTYNSLPCGSLNITTLRHLNIAGNQLTNVPPCLPTALEFLDLRQNVIQWVNFSEFMDLHKLKILLLSHNNISKIGSSGTKLPHIVSLDLSYNNFRRSQWKFQGPNLTTLRLEGNPLQEISPYEFNPFPKLRYLNLSSTSLESCSYKAFASETKSIKTLDLSENLFKNFDPQCFEGLSNLQILWMRRMPFLQSLPDDLFLFTSNLTQVNLEENSQLHFVKSSMFEQLPHLQTLSLKSCNLTEFRPWKLFTNSTIEITLSGNHLVCSCELSWLIKEPEKTFLNRANDTGCVKYGPRRQILLPGFIDECNRNGNTTEELQTYSRTVQNQQQEHTTVVYQNPSGIKVKSSSKPIQCSTKFQLSFTSFTNSTNLLHTLLLLKTASNPNSGTLQTKESSTQNNETWNKIKSSIKMSLTLPITSRYQTTAKLNLQTTTDHTETGPYTTNYVGESESETYPTIRKGTVTKPYPMTTGRSQSGTKLNPNIRDKIQPEPFATKEKKAFEPYPTNGYQSVTKLYPLTIRDQMRAKLFPATKYHSRTKHHSPTTTEQTGTELYPTKEQTGTELLPTREQTGIEPLPTIKEQTGTEPHPNREQIGTEPLPTKERTGTELLPTREQTEIEPLPTTKEQTGTEPHPNREQIGTEPLPTKERTGTELLPTREQTGIEPLPTTKEQTGTEPHPNGKQIGAEPLPITKEQTGTEPHPTRKQIGTEPLPNKEQTGTEPHPTREQTGTEPLPITKEQTGTEPHPTGKQIGTEPLPTKEQTGTKPFPTQEQTGTTPLPTRKQTGTEPHPTREQIGTEPQPTREQTGTTPLPTREQTGTEPHPTREQIGTEPQPTREQTGTEPQPTREQTGTEPHPLTTRVETETEPHPNKEQTGTEPQPTREQTGTEPQPTREQTGTEPQPTREQTGTEPQPNREQTWTEPHPNREQTGIEPLPTRGQTATEPQPTREQTGIEPLPTREEIGTEPLPLTTREQTGTEPHPNREQFGTEPHPTRKQTGTEPHPTREQTGTEPHLTREQTVTEPHPTREHTGIEPPPNREETGTEPLPTKEQTGTESHPNREETGTEPLPTSDQIGTEPHPTRKQTGTDPLPNREETGTEPHPLTTRDETGTEFQTLAARNSTWIKSYPETSRDDTGPIRTQTGTISNLITTSDQNDNKYYPLFTRVQSGTKQYSTVTMQTATYTPKKGPVFIHIEDDDTDSLEKEEITSPTPGDCNYDPCRHWQVPCHDLKHLTGCRCPVIAGEDVIPDPVKIQKVMKITDNSAEIFWCAPSSTVMYYYIIYQSDDNRRLFKTDTIKPTYRRYTLRDLIADSTYHTCVVAVNKAGSSTTSSIWPSKGSCYIFKTKPNYNNIFYIASTVIIAILFILVITLSFCLCKIYQRGRLTSLSRISLDPLSLQNPAFEDHLELADPRTEHTSSPDSEQIL